MSETINVQIQCRGAERLLARLEAHLADEDGAVVCVPPSTSGWSSLAFERLRGRAIERMVQVLVEELGGRAVVIERGEAARITVIRPGVEPGRLRVEDGELVVDGVVLSALGLSELEAELTWSPLVMLGRVTSLLGLERVEDFPGLLELNAAGTRVLSGGRRMSISAFRAERGLVRETRNRARDVAEIGVAGNALEPTLHLHLRDNALPGQTVEATVVLEGGSEEDWVDALEVRVLGRVELGYGERPYASTIQVTRDVELEAQAVISFSVMLDVPVNAVPSVMGARWSVVASAKLVGGDRLVVEDVFGVEVDDEAPLYEESGLAEEDATTLAEVEELFDAGEVAALDAGPALDIPGARVRFSGSVYELEANLEDSELPAIAVDGAAGRYLRLDRVEGGVRLRCGLRPRSVVELSSSFVEELGLDVVPWLEEVIGGEDALTLSPLERWDQVHRRVLVMFARQMSEGAGWPELVLLAEAVRPGSSDALEPNLSVRAREARHREALRLAFQALTDVEGAGPLRAMLRGMPPQPGALEGAESVASRSVSEVKTQIRAMLEGSHWEDAIGLANQAIRAYALDAELYALKATAFMNLGLELRTWHGEQISFSTWRYPDRVEERARRIRAGMERAFEIALWLEPSAAVAAQLGEMLKHPMDALGAFEMAHELAPESDHFRVLYAQALIRAEGRREGQRARDLLESLVSGEFDVESLDADARELRVLAAQWSALASVLSAYDGGEPTYYHFGLTGEPAAVRGVEGAVELLRGAVSVLDGVDAEGWDRRDETAWLREQVEQLRLCVEQGEVQGLKAGVAFARLARQYGVERLGRWARAVALHGHQDERKVTRLLRRAEICEQVFAREDSERLFESAEVLCSREMIPVLEARVRILRERDDVSAARELELRLVRIAPEQMQRAEKLMSELMEHGEMALAIALFRFFLLEMRGSRTVLERLVAWAIRLSGVFESLGDSYRARQPLEWLLFLGTELEEGERTALQAARDSMEGRFPDALWHRGVMQDDGAGGEGEADD